MLRRHPLLEAFEADQLRRPVSYGENIKVYEALWDEARLLGVLPSKQPLDGIEVDLALARAVNAVGVPGAAGADRRGPR